MKKTCTCVHRTYIHPLFINYAAEDSSSALLTFDEYKKISKNKEILKLVYQLPHDFWTNENLGELEKYDIEFLQKMGISKEEYLVLRSFNYQKQLDQYFENGLYIQRPMLETTVSVYSDEEAEKKIKKLLGKKGMGFNGGNNLLGALSGRVEMNAVLELEIPKQCFETRAQPQKVFEDATPLTLGTAYFGIQEMTKVIPAKYIKCAHIVSTYDQLDFENKSFDSDYVVANGFCDSDKIDSFVEHQISRPFDIDNIKSLVNFVEQECKQKQYSYVSNLEKIAGKLSDNLMKDEDYEYLVQINENITEYKRSQRNQLEVFVDDMIENDLLTQSPQKIADKLENFIVISKNSLKNNIKDSNYNQVYKDYETIKKGLCEVNRYTYNAIGSDNRFNYIYGQIETMKKLCDLRDQYFENANNINHMVVGEEDRYPNETKQMNANYMASALLIEALHREANVANKIVEFIEKNDLSKVDEHQICEIAQKIEDIVNNKDISHTQE